MTTQLAALDFNSLATGETTIGARAVRMLDFDKPNVEGIEGIWNCREYFITAGTLRYTLGFGTTNKAGMFDLYDRMAKCFEILPE